MKSRNIAYALILGTAIIMSASAKAWTASESRKEIRVNSDVTTIVVMPENIKMVDISTPNIIGNQCTDNMVRLKPAPMDSVNTVFGHNQFLGTITLIGERNVAQYDIIYDRLAENAESYFNVSYNDTRAYSNPEVSMPESEMAKFAWAIYGSKRKFNNIKKRANGIKAQIFNIYSIGNYFFIDYGLENHTNIDYKIEEVRVTLTDKKETKATNSQTIEINPVFTLNPATSFKKNFRQVMVLDKLTFPDEKVINITISENQISGRVITLTMEYNDVLNADGFDFDKEENIRNVRYVTSGKDKGDTLTRTSSNLEKKNSELSTSLTTANKEIQRLKEEISSLNAAYTKLEVAYRGANKTIEEMLSKSKGK